MPTFERTEWMKIHITGSPDASSGWSFLAQIFLSPGRDL
jgi:hypothetical protein